jgi:hypothetical protein
MPCTGLRPSATARIFAASMSKPLTAKPTSAKRSASGRPT